MHDWRGRIGRCGTLVGVLVGLVSGALAADPRSPPGPWRTPVSVAITPSGRWMATANQASGTVSLIDEAAGRVVDEIRIGARPSAVVSRGSERLVAVASEAGDVVVLEVVERRLVEVSRIHVGYEPHGAALSPDGRTAWIPRAATAEVVAVDLETGAVSAPIETGALPRYVAVSADGSTVAVACAAGAEIVLVDVRGRSVLSRHPFKGLNIGQPAFTPDGATVYFPFTYDGGGFTSPGDIRRGWVTGSRIGRLATAAELDTDEGSRLRGLTLDVSGRAVGDVLGLALADEGRTLLVSAGGTHELLRLDTAAPTPLPWTQISGEEVMDRRLAADPARFRRLDLGGRPLGVTAAAHGRILVANGLLDEVQEVDPAGPDLVRSIPLSRGEVATERELLVRRGEAIFHDARRSLDQWYSCHTCHWEGGGNTVTFDTLNDGSVGTYKSVLPLWDLAATGPWTWHGWQNDLTAAVKKSMIDTMQAPEPDDADVAALEAFLTELEPPPSPFRQADGGLSEAAERGQALFLSSRTACADCHAGPTYTTTELHDVGLGRKGDRYPTYSVPTLLAGFRKTRWLHNARARSLHDLLTGPHSPEKVSGQAPLTAAEIDDLVAWLKSL